MPAAERRGSLDGHADRPLDEVKEAHLIPSMVNGGVREMGRKEEKRDRRDIVKIEEEEIGREEEK